MPDMSMYGATLFAVFTGLVIRKLGGSLTVLIAKTKKKWVIPCAYVRRPHRRISGGDLPSRVARCLPGHASVGSIPTHPACISQDGLM